MDLKKIITKTALALFLSSSFCTRHIHYHCYTYYQKPKVEIKERYKVKAKQIQIELLIPDVVIRIKCGKLEKLGFYLPSDFGGCEQKRKKLLKYYIETAYKKYFDYLRLDTPTPRFLEELSKRELKEIQNKYCITQLKPGDKVIFEPDYIPKY